MPEETVRDTDFSRFDRQLAELNTGQGMLSSKLSDLRVLMAEGYVKKVDLETVKSDLRREWNEDIKSIREVISVHAEADTRTTLDIHEAINGLRTMLWGLLAGMLVTFGALITLLVSTIVHSPHS